MYKVIENFYEGQNFNVKISYEENPEGEDLIFVHNQWFTEPTPSSIKEVRKVLKELKEHFANKGETVLFANTTNFKFIELMKEPYDKISVDNSEEGLIAWPLQPTS